MDELLAEYVRRRKTLKGSDITRDNYRDVIEELSADERSSGGVIKNGSVTTFLEGWFS